MAKQNLSKKGVERFKKKKVPKGERGHKKKAPGGPPGGGSPHGAKPGRTRSLLRKKNYGAEKRNRGERKKKKGPPQSGGVQGYDRSQRILLVGEGNLSMARALLRIFEGNGRNLIATTYDTEAELLEKYAESAEIIEELHAGGVLTAFGVDATNLRKHMSHVRKQWREAAAAAPPRPADADGDDAMDEDAAPKPALSVPEVFDRVVFNFPHRALGIKDQDHNVKANQELLAGFFRGAVELLAPGGEVRVTLKAGLPYSLWNAPKLATQATKKVGPLALRTALQFDPAAFPGYAHRRTHGDGVSRPNAEELAGGARTYCWRRAIEEPAPAAADAMKA